MVSTDSDARDENPLRNKVLKIGDYGLLREWSSKQDSTKSWVGTENYMAPEMRDRTDRKYTDKVDIYALGVITEKMAKCKYLHLILLS